MLISRWWTLWVVVIRLSCPFATWIPNFFRSWWTFNRLKRISPTSKTYLPFASQSQYVMGLFKWRSVKWKWKNLMASSNEKFTFVFCFIRDTWTTFLSHWVKLLFLSQMVQRAYKYSNESIGLASWIQRIYSKLATRALNKERLGDWLSCTTCAYSKMVALHTNRRRNIN